MKIFCWGETKQKFLKKKQKKVNRFLVAKGRGGGGGGHVNSGIPSRKKGVDQGSCSAGVRSANRRQASQSGNGLCISR